MLNWQLQFLISFGERWSTKSKSHFYRGGSPQGGRRARALNAVWSRSVRTGRRKKTDATRAFSSADSRGSSASDELEGWLMRET
ncbi:hypothetical protein QQF64_024612 [Cirrhinus molitorella]|uniref:Uncharacterized protein n=1 Tax=Cirrhinus molitorella TaxID=172907 RepID=A0ABR3NM05_9TELE